MATERLLEANELIIERFQPKQANRFIMYIDGVPAWVIKTASAKAIITIAAAAIFTQN